MPTTASSRAAGTTWPRRRGAHPSPRRSAAPARRRAAAQGPAVVTWPRAIDALVDLRAGARGIRREDEGARDTACAGRLRGCVGHRWRRGRCGATGIMVRTTGTWPCASACPDAMPAPRGLRHDRRPGGRRHRALDRQGAHRRLRQALRAVPRLRARCEAAVRGGQLPRDRPPGPRPHRLYDRRVGRLPERIEREFVSARLTSRARTRCWARSSCHYIGMLIDTGSRSAPNLFNSVSCKILPPRTYFQQRFIWRPAQVTEYLDADRHYRSYYPAASPACACADRHRARPAIEQRFRRLPPRPPQRLAAFRRRYSAAVRAATSLQIQVLGSLFFRNPTAYIGTAESTASTCRAFAVPLKQRRRAGVSCRRACSQPPSSRCCSRRTADATSWHMERPVRVREVPELAAARQDRGRAVHGCRPAEARQDAVFRRTFLHHLRHFHLTASVRRPGDQGLVRACHAALLSLCVQSDQDRIAASKDTDRGTAQAESNALVSTTPLGRDRHPRVLRRGFFPRDASRRSCWTSWRRWRRRNRARRRPTSSSGTSTSSAG